MLEYWKLINYQPETKEMNFEENDSEDEANQPDTIDHHSLRRVDTEMLTWYGGVAIKGFEKDADLTEVVDILKEAGLPFNYGPGDLQVVDKGKYVTISVRDLKPESCLEIQNKLDGVRKFGKKISVFPLVDNSPTKKDGKELERLITETNNDDNERSLGDESKDISEDEYHSSPD